MHEIQLKQNMGDKAGKENIRQVSSHTPPTHDRRHVLGSQRTCSLFGGGPPSLSSIMHHHPCLTSIQGSQHLGEPEKDTCNICAHVSRCRHTFLLGPHLCRAQTYLPKSSKVVPQLDLSTSLFFHLYGHMIALQLM